MTPHEETIARGRHAERLLGDETLANAFAAVRMAILERIEAAPVRDRDGVHELKLMLKLLRDVRGNLEQAARDGQLLRVTIEREKKGLLDRVGDFFGEPMGI